MVFFNRAFSRGELLQVGYSGLIGFGSEFEILFRESLADEGVDGAGRLSRAVRARTRSGLETRPAWPSQRPKVESLTAKQFANRIAIVGQRIAEESAVRRIVRGCGAGAICIQRCDRRPRDHGIKEGLFAPIARRRDAGQREVADVLPEISRPVPLPLASSFQPDTAANANHWTSEYALKNPSLLKSRSAICVQRT